MSPVTYSTRKQSRGFTFVELLIAVAISLVLATAAGAPIYGNLKGATELHDTTSQLKQTLRAARERAVAGLGNSAHGVYIEHIEGGPYAMILYRGVTYDTRDASYDQRISIPASLAVSSTVGGDVSFAQGTGIPSTSGVVRLANVVEGNTAISISALGVIEEDRGLIVE